MELSKYQQEIIKYYQDNPTTNMQINAFAGSGKSFILKLLSDFSTKSDIYMAFNNTVAKEMETKITNPKVKIKTFHALAYSFMLYNLKEINNPYKKSSGGIGKQRDNYNSSNDIVSLDNLKIYNILEDFYQNRRIDFEEKIWLKDNYVQLYNLIRLTKNEFNEKNVAYLIKEHGLFTDYEYGLEVPTIKRATETIKYIDKESLEVFENEHKIDFTDMIYITYNKIVNKEWSVPFWGLFTNILIDECQDLNNLQLAFLKYIKRNNGRYIFVGDFFQSAYGFSGSNAQSFNLIKKIFAPIKEFDLPICYRCPTSHLEKVNKEFHIPIQPRPDAPKGKIITIEKKDIIKYVKIGDLVIARKNKWLTGVILDLATHDIPIFMQDKEMVDNIFRIINKINGVYAKDVVSKLQEKKKANEQKMLEHAQKMAEIGANALEQGDGYEDVNPNDIVSETLKYLETSKNDLMDFIVIIAENYVLKHPKATKEDFVVYLKKLLNTTNIKDCVRVTSVHKAKGLEANQVFVLNEGKVCYNFRNSKEQNEQETNLSYISMTRAKEKMYLVKEEEEVNLPNEMWF